MPGVLAAIVWALDAHAADPNVYFGNLHSHTSYSDGSGKPADAYKFARDVADLDFLAVTEHNHALAESGAGDRRDGILIATDHTLYNGSTNSSLISAAKRFTSDGTFVALYGQEFSSIGKGNHMNVFDVPNVITSENGEFAHFVNTWLPANVDTSGSLALIQFNHPSLFPTGSDEDPAWEYGSDEFVTAAGWLAALDPLVELIEIANGPAKATGPGEEPADTMESDYRAYLNLGFHLAPTANQDNHYKTWGVASQARTAVLATTLTKQAIVGALRARHVYATTDRNLRLWYWLDGHLMGDRTAAPTRTDGSLDVGHRIKIEFRVVDDDEPEAQYKVEIWSDRIGGPDVSERVDTVASTGNTPGTTRLAFDDLTYAGGEQYVYLKVVQRDEDGEGDVAWTAPVWLESGADAPVDDAGAVFLASKNSLIYHISSECSSAQQIAPQNLITGPSAKEGRTQHVGCPK